jgi:hypothetical protein
VKFDKIERLDIKSRNSLFAGYVGKNKFFIKRYVFRKGMEKEDLLKARCEILCYRNLKSMNLPRVVEADYRKRLLVLDFVRYRDVVASKKTVDGILDLRSRVMKGIDASFLPKVTYAYYSSNLHRQAMELKDRKIIKDLNGIFDQFEESKIALNESARYFSHGDLRFGNIKYLGQRLTIIDMEHSRRDNLMCDLAGIYADLSDKKALADYFMNRITKMKEFDGDLFTLMLYRRCIEILHALKGTPASSHYKKAKELIETISPDK